MGWSYKHRKLRDTLRKQFSDETGRNWRDPCFLAWVEARASTFAQPDPCSATILGDEHDASGL